MCVCVYDQHSNTQTNITNNHDSNILTLQKKNHITEEKCLVQHLTNIKIDFSSAITRWKWWENLVRHPKDTNVSGVSINIPEFILVIALSRAPILV